MSKYMPVNDLLQGQQTILGQANTNLDALALGISVQNDLVTECMVKLGEASNKLAKMEAEYNSTRSLRDSLRETLENLNAQA